MKAGVIFEEAKVNTSFSSSIESATTTTLVKAQSETLSAQCDFIKDAWASALYQWVTESSDGKISVTTGYFMCRYNENVGTPPHCPAFACDNDSTYFQCERCVADWKA